MARKNVLSGITSSNAPRPEKKVDKKYAEKGASRSMINTLHELREKAGQAEMVTSGEAVLEFDPDLLDVSFVVDRFDEEEESAFLALKNAIEEKGQETPILVRPSPATKGRYQIVFGHRRARVAKALGNKVRAIVKEINDVDHVIAQGQENSARENLSFIERATFAQHLLNLGYEKNTVLAALSIDAPMLTRMISVTSRVPEELLKKIGRARTIGRDRWIKFAQQIEKPSNLEIARQLVQAEDFSALESEARFEFLNSQLQNVKKNSRSAALSKTWQSSDRGVDAALKDSGRSYSISLKSRDASQFGRFISENLDRLHDEFVRSNKGE